LYLQLESRLKHQHLVRTGGVLSLQEQMPVGFGTKIQ
jgi:hypothetical protein